jgi:hypothetical protein
LRNRYTINEKPYNKIMRKKIRKGLAKKIKTNIHKGKRRNKGQVYCVFFEK